MKPFDITAKCGWDGDVFHIELPETPREVCVHHPDGLVYFGVPTRVEQELRDEISELRRKSMLSAFDLIAENEKLRCLARDMWDCMAIGDGENCNGCPRCEECEDGILGFVGRMQDLKVDVYE